MTDKTQAARDESDEDNPHSQFALLRERRFWPLFVTQFTGAFNDNAYKTALVVVLGFAEAKSWTSMEAGVLTNLAMALFILPFFLFSAIAGQLADKFDKARLARWVKALETPIILLAGAGFWLHSLPLLLAALCLLGLQSTLFGPLKYALLPQHLLPCELVGGNALVEAGTFVAILLGTLVGGMLAGLDGDAARLIAICLIMAVGGFFSSCRIPAAPAPAPDLRISPNIFAETWRCIALAGRERSVFQSILGISWFWAYGALLLTQFPMYTKEVLGGDKGMITLLLAVFSIGIGAGSLVCEKLTRRRGKIIEPGLVPIGALGMTIFGLDLALGAPAGAAGMMHPLADMLGQTSTWRALFDLLMLGGFGGLYCVPLYALVQQRTEAQYRARIIAANNILNALFMAVISVAAAAFLGQGFAIPTLFLGMAILHGIVAAYIFSVVPEFLIRTMVWLGVRRE
ncbi:MAG: MFS transporter [Betaproteobacteria bacterium]|nr:MFS transporter [Betaproteobacteria bacterium]